jgi:hypothetical protein
MGPRSNGRRWIFSAFILFMVGHGVRGAPLPKSSPSGEEVFRLNCGAVGWDYTDPRGNYWLQDEAYSKNNRWGYVNGAAVDEGSPVGTDIVPVYRTQRRGNTALKYVVELPNGTYQVTLHFIETVYSAPGQRVFDVALQGNVVLDNLDVFPRAGGQNRPYAATFSVMVTGQKLEVTFPVINAGFATLSGLEVKVQSVSDDAFLDFLQFKMYRYFWTEVGATTGLVSDKSNGWFDDDFMVASIGTTGFGLSVLTVAAERGWITSDQARQRILATLNFFQTMQTDPARSYHGLWFHFVDRDTGQRAWASEVSTVDSALFILGALQAGEYFRSTDPTIAQKAEELYRNMEWDWFANRRGDVPFLVSHGWKPDLDVNATIAAPDRGFFIQYQWDAYNESVFVNLLALGSPTHAIDKEAWVRMRRHAVGSDSEGYTEFMHFPPLFGHQYHNLYFDFKNKHDGTSDFWDAAARATLKDRAQCSADPRYEADIWGLTACEVPPDPPPPDGYEVFGTDPDGYNRGVTAPTGPLASIPLTPTESIVSARKMFFQYKHAIWGRYGFVDSFSTSEGGRADNTLGLDNGPIVLAIENYRSGLIGGTFMKSPFAAAGLSKAGFVASGEAPRIFSSSQKDDHRAPLAQDGNVATLWESVWANDQWWALDFGKSMTLNHLRLTWGDGFGRVYRVQTSNDGTNWTTVKAVTDGNGGEEVVRFSKTSARMVRVFGVEPGSANGPVRGFSLAEVAVGDDSAPTDVASAKIYPNPFRRARSPDVKIEDIPEGAQVTLYTLSGEKVCALLPADSYGKTTWDGRNSGGQSVAAAVYFGVIQANGQKKVFRIAVQ